ncbi:GntR family transcriptional regulator [Lentibacillus sp. N15]|uniref:GntR family transcriptional regulator n=1 Tax=Lentibacillus songyuanensis TaxID=3136161 RepID=UPI0031BA83E8
MIKTSLEDQLNHNSPIPLHHQLSEIIRRRMLNGELTDEDGKLPTEMELTKQFNVSRITVRTALKTLLNEGMLLRKRGRGTFLKTNSAENWNGKLMGFSEAIKSAGFNPGAKVVQSGLTNIFPDKVKENFASEELWELKRIRFADGEPIAIEQSFFSKKIGEEFEKHGDLDHLVTYQFIEQRLKIKIHKGKQLISAVNADLEESEVLNINKGQALLYMERLAVSSENEPIEFLKSVYRPDYFQYIVQLNRN